MLAKIVIAEANSGDQIALNICGRAISHLIELAFAVLNRGFELYLKHNSQDIELVAGGGVFQDEGFWSSFTNSWAERPSSNSTA